jgi:transcriptional regulator with XRE-family HTH domain
MPDGTDIEALYRDVGEAIRSVRGAMSQDELASRIGKDQRTLSGYESGRVRVPLDVIVAIAEKCEVRASTILGRAGIVEVNTEAAIESDPTLTPFKRKSVLNFYRYTRDEFDEGLVGRE